MAKNLLLSMLFLVSAFTWVFAGTAYGFSLFMWLTSAGGYVIAFAAGVVAATES